MDLESQLQGQTRLSIVQIQTTDLDDSLQAVVEGIAMDVEDPGGLTHVRIPGEKDLQRIHQLGIV